MSTSSLMKPDITTVTWDDFFVLIFEIRSSFIFGTLPVVCAKMIFKAFSAIKAYPSRV